jgi:hypothetical protein
MRQLPMDDVHNEITGGRPLGHTNRHSGIALERDLAHTCAVRSRHPEIGVAAVVGEIHQFGSVGADRWRLHLTGLPRDGNGLARVVACRLSGRKLPNIRLTPYPRDDQSTRVVDVRFHEGRIARGDLRIVRPIQVDGVQVERRPIRQRAPGRRTVDKTAAVRQPCGTAHESSATDRSALAAVCRHDKEPLVPHRPASAMERQPGIVGRPAR